LTENLDGHGLRTTRVGEDVSAGAIVMCVRGIVIESHFDTMV